MKNFQNMVHPFLVQVQGFQNERIDRSKFILVHTQQIYNLQSRDIILFDHWQLIAMDNQSSNQCKNKFISTMKSITMLLIEDLSPQMAVYEQLNSQDLKNLFQSLHNEDVELRVTAAKFISYLLFGNYRIVESLLMKSNCDAVQINPIFVVGGLNPYKLNSTALKEVILSLQKIKYHANTLCWSINLKTYKITYLPYRKIKNQSENAYENSIFDPKYNVIGIFVNKGEENVKKQKIQPSISTTQKKSISNSSTTQISRQKYVISKK